MSHCDMTSPWRQNFPALRDNAVAYLDHASTCQVPDVVLAATAAYEALGRANAHRGLYPWAERATAAYEAARTSVAAFAGADPARLVFTKGTTDGLNLVAASLAERLGPGDEVVVTLADHHSGLLPWRVAALRRGFTVRTIGLTPTGELAVDRLRAMLGPATRVVALPMASNVLGTLYPVAEVVRVAAAVGAFVVVDAAQAAGHVPLNFAALGCDVLAWGSHKMYGPIGIGALAVSERLFGTLVPTAWGGGMVDSIEPLTRRGGIAGLEAGTPNVAGAVGFAAAAAWLAGIGWDAIAAHERRLLERLLVALAALPVHLVGSSTTSGRIGIVSFNLDGVHCHDVAQILGAHGVCVRSGHHCAEPLAAVFAPSGSVRASLGLPNDERDIDRLVEGLRAAQRMFC